MQEPTRFGDFLLLKKLSEDPLGELYRAGRIDATSAGELVLLRTFTVPGADAGELVKHIRQGAAPRHRIQGPGLTYQSAGGEVGGVPYAAYEYTTGWDVLRFLAKSSSGFAEAEADHALLIAERLAKGLAVVHQADPTVARPYHGFFVPWNVRLSGEGEIGLLGFEPGPYLAWLAAQGRLSELHPYLSPEVRAGQTPTPADDIYSLGALLWQLLIGRPPSLDEPGGWTAALAAARLADGEILPAGLAELLQSSFAAPRARTANAALWHKQLTDWMSRKEIRTTHFDLAFFVHELFRREIQDEQAEIERERQLDLSPQPAPPVEGPEMSDVLLRPDLSGMVERPVLATAASRQDGAEAAAVPARSSRRSWIPLGVAAAAILAAVAVGAVLLRGDDPPPPPPPPPLQPPPPAAPRSDALQVAKLELQRLMDEAKASRDQLAAEYDEQIQSLTEQLEAAEAAEAEALRAARAAAEAVPPPAAPDPPSEPDPTGEGGTSVAPGTAEDEALPSRSPSPTPPASAPPAAATTTPPAPAPPPPALPPASAAPPASTTSPPPPASLAPPSEATADSGPRTARESPPPSPPPAIVIPPVRKHMPEPRFPSRARQLRREETVLIKVLVDTDGQVIDARPVIDKPDTFGFIKEALRAARAAEFEPARSNGVPTRMWTTVVMSFRLRK